MTNQEVTHAAPFRQPADDAAAAAGRAHGRSGRLGAGEWVLGDGLPSDYRDFLAVYGAGTIDDYIGIGTALDRSFGHNEKMLAALTGVARSLAQEEGDCPYPVWPDKGGLICWGTTIDCAVLFWDTAGSDPDRWPVVVCNRQRNFTRLDGGMVEFLIRMLGPSGERPLVSPRLFGAPNSRFLSMAEERRLIAEGTDPWEYLEALFEGNEADDDDA
ncbi:hypothetical protein [Peterkaempfera sp. SMS 1(5)a]|uniref:hypothetical protein n=1 Tax=Peterkaempfera podocarpi TaxID=3232308 RepID=UPI00366B67BE